MIMQIIVQIAGVAGCHANTFAEGTISSQPCFEMQRPYPSHRLASVRLGSLGQGQGTESRGFNVYCKLIRHLPKLVIIGVVF